MSIPHAAPGAKSCVTCPSFLEGAKQTSTLGTNLGAPICGRKMLPLISPRQTREAATRALGHIASNCKFHGETVRLDPLPASSAPQLPIGIPGTVAEPSSSDKATAPNCLTCEHYVSAGQVQREYGWTGSLCLANGTLMPDARLLSYAKSCGKYVRQVGARRAPSFTGFTLLPAFSDTFGKIDTSKVYNELLDHYVDPSEWPTDRPVTDKQEARGIRAWRKIEDPEGYGEPVYLPVFDKNFFSEDERALIPQASDPEAPHLYADHGGIMYAMAVVWMQLDDTPAAWGQGGTGKTELGRHMSWMMQLPFHRIVINAASEIDDIAGKILFEGGQTVVHLGRLSQAWIKPGIILLDEPNTGPNDVWQLIRPLTDNSRLLTLDNLKGQRLKRHIDCFFYLAMNPAWDPRNVGAHEIGDADSSRLTHMFFELPPREVEEAIIQRRVKLDKWEVPTKQLKALMDTAREIRELSDQGTIHTTWGVRHNIKVARLLRWFHPTVAYRRAAGDALEPSQWELLSTVVTSHFGG